MISQNDLDGLVFNMLASRSCGKSWVCAPTGSYQNPKTGTNYIHRVGVKLGSQKKGVVVAFQSLL